MSTCGNDRILFLHVAKTGGYWVCEAMKRAGIEVQQEVPDVFHAKLHQLEVGERFAFAFVREPLSWCGSTWQFRRLRGMEREEHPSTWADLPFEDYLTVCIEEDPGFLGNYYELSTGPRENEIDFVGRYEKLEDDFLTAMHLAGETVDPNVIREIAPINVSAPPPPCPEELRQRLRISESVVYERWYED
jgi:hypothetical protein